MLAVDLLHCTTPASSAVAAAAGLPYNGDGWTDGSGAGRTVAVDPPLWALMRSSVAPQPSAVVGVLFPAVAPLLLAGNDPATTEAVMELVAFSAAETAPHVVYASGDMTGATVLPVGSVAAHPAAV